MQALFGNSVIRITAVVIKVVAIADVERFARAWRPAEHELRADFFADGRVIEPQACKDVARELIRRARAENVVVKGDASRVVAHEADFVVIERRLKIGRQLVAERRLDEQLIARSRIILPVRAEVVIHLSPCVVNQHEREKLLVRRGFDKCLHGFEHGRALRVVAGECARSAEFADGTEFVLINALAAVLKRAADEGLTLQSEHALRVCNPVLHASSPIVADVRRVLDAFEDNRFFRVLIGFVLDEGTQIIRVGALAETDVGAVIVRPADGEIIHVKISVRAFDPDVVTDAVARAVGSFVEVGVIEKVARRRADQLKFGDRFLIEAESSVKTARVIVAVNKIISRGEKAEIVFLADVAFEAHYADVCVLIDNPLVSAKHARIRAILLAKPNLFAVVRVEIAGRVVGGVHNAERVLAASARDFGGDVGIDDRARVNDVHRRLENIDSFEKERAFFRKENRKALVGGRYGRVRFDLRKVRIIRKIERHRRRQAEFRG